MNKLNETFNITPGTITEVIDTTGDVIAPNEGCINDNADVDYIKTRTNLYNLLSQGQEALQFALNVAKQSEHPRAFEVVGGLVKQLADVNHQLMDLSDKIIKMRTNSSAPTTSVTNNSLFVGSTAELSKLIKSMTTGDDK